MQSLGTSFDLQGIALDGEMTKVDFSLRLFDIDVSDVLHPL